MKYLLITTTSRSVMNFRTSFIKHLKNKNEEVIVISQDDEMKTEIENLGVKFYCVNENNRGLNPLRMLNSIKKYKKIILNENPDYVLTYQLKPNIFGVVAAKKAKVKKIYPMVEGAGDVFINSSLKWKIIRFVVCRLYKYSFKYANKVFFLNNDDKTEFVNRKLLKEEQCFIINGIGVDTEKFGYKPLKNKNVFLMVARMIKTKGIMEYCEAARKVKKVYPDAVFNYLGAEGNIKVSDIQEYIDDGSIIYLGLTNDVRPHLEDCTMLVLPSYYREGLPMSIMEAMSVGRGIITTDNVGCRETVEDGINGILINKENIVEELSEKIIDLVSKKNDFEKFSLQSRTLAENKFGEKKINETLISIIEG